MAAATSVPWAIPVEYEAGGCDDCAATDCQGCAFESNFPVDKVSFSYNVMYNAFKRFSKSYSAFERAAMFHDTATRVYRVAV